MFEYSIVWLILFVFGCALFTLGAIHFLSSSPLLLGDDEAENNLPLFTRSRGGGGGVHGSTWSSEYAYKPPPMIPKPPRKEHRRERERERERKKKNKKKRYDGDSGSDSEDYDEEAAEASPPRRDRRDSRRRGKDDVW